ALEIVEQLGERLSRALPCLREAVERLETATGALLEDDARSRNPVGALAMDQMADHIERAPRVGTFGRVGPFARESVEHGAEHARRALEDRETGREGEGHRSWL